MTMVVVTMLAWYRRHWCWHGWHLISALVA